MPFSDWDFVIKTSDFWGVAGRLPALVEPLEPLGRFWDPLAAEWCYILMMRGPFGVDLIFDEGHELEQPWVVSDVTLPIIDTHFWNWIWWLSTKDRRGDADRVSEELRRMEWFLLGPLEGRGDGLSAQETPNPPPQPPSGIADAVARFLATRGRIQSALEADVLSGLRRAGYDV